MRYPTREYQQINHRARFVKARLLQRTPIHTSINTKRTIIIMERKPHFPIDNSQPYQRKSELLDIRNCGATSSSAGIVTPWIISS